MLLELLGVTRKRTKVPDTSRLNVPFASTPWESTTPPGASVSDTKVDVTETLEGETLTRPVPCNAQTLEPWSPVFERTHTRDFMTKMRRVRPVMLPKPGILATSNVPMVSGLVLLVVVAPAAKNET